MCWGVFIFTIEKWGTVTTCHHSPRKWREKLSPPGIYLIGIFSELLEFGQTKRE